MSEENQLDGLSVLVIEDDFYLAEDTSYALQQAGARVLGPYGAYDEAREAVVQDKPDCAVLDINLGEGPDFTPADAMLSNGVPVLFISGYDKAVVPSDLSHVRFLQKPTTGVKIVQAVRQLCSR